MKRRASLTTKVDGSELMRMDKLYPGHAKALQTEKLAPNIFPTLCEVLDNQQMYPNIDDDKGKKNNKDTRAVRFCLGMNKWWNNPVHARLKELPVPQVFR